MYMVAVLHAHRKRRGGLLLFSSAAVLSRRLWPVTVRRAGIYFNRLGRNALGRPHEHITHRGERKPEPSVKCLLANCSSVRNGYFNCDSSWKQSDSMMPRQAKIPNIPTRMKQVRISPPTWPLISRWRWPTFHIERDRLEQNLIPKTTQIKSVIFRWNQRSRWR